MTPPPRDQRERDRLVEDLDSTLFVEAGAGTGKTTAVVSRVVALVSAGELSIDRLVAITFTEAAAAELRVRIRQGLEERSLDPQRDPTERDRCQAALEGLDAASIDTIHAFASALLRTWPIQAGLPPDFEVLADIDQDTEFRERVRRWLDGLRPGTAEGDAVGRALLLGLPPDRLSRIATGLENNHDLVTPATEWRSSPPPDALDAAHELGWALLELGGRSHVCHVPGDGLLGAITDAQFAAGRLRDASTQDAALVALRMVERIEGKGSGNQANWPAGVCKEIKEQLRSIEAAAVSVLSAHRTTAISAVAAGLRDVVLDAVEQRRRRGVATFHDLLTWARNLLRDRPDVLRAAQRRWERIIVDEFQDTDPLQAELAFMLASEPGRPLPERWWDAPLVAGKLMLVGDPKQSIYRFRRADIAVYDAVKEVILGGGGRPVHLQENFRSIEPVIAWVNEHFSAAIAGDRGIQAEYIALLAHRAGSGPGVWTMGEKVDVKMAEVWQAEATDVAMAARRVVADRWQVSNPAAGASAIRSAGYSDICILIPTRTNLRRLERALDSARVPYQVASGSLLVATQEVRDLISCLRAIDDPTDQVALLAALRSPAFGVSDVELLRWREAGGSFDYDRSHSSLGGRIGAAFTDLERLHRDRHDISPAALIEAILDERLLVAAAFDAPRPREVWRRYRYVAERARAFAATGRTTLRAFVDWMETLQRDEVRDAGGTSIDPDEDAVRILTVHGAKGLESPVVILTGSGSVRVFQHPNVVADRIAGRLEFKVGDFSTTGYDHLKQREEAMDRAESVRLMYVAATRARDHLIVSLHRGRSDKCHAAEFAKSLATFARASSMSTDPLADEAGAVSTASPAEVTVEQSRAEEDAWLEQRRELVAAFRAIDVRSATGIAHERAEEEVPAREEDVAAYRRGRAATALGRAVHAVLQVIDLEQLAGLDELARAQAVVEGAGDRVDEVVGLVRTAAGSEAVRRAVAGGRYWRETPVVASVDGVVLEGFIDLLYAESDGGLVVVDYKTDTLSRGQVAGRLDRYRLQGGVYALLVEETTGRRVSRVEFVFASLGVTEPLQDLAGALEEVRALLGMPPAPADNTYE